MQELRLARVHMLNVANVIREYKLEISRSLTNRLRVERHKALWVEVYACVLDIF